MPQNVPNYTALNKTIGDAGLTVDVMALSAQVAALSTWANTQTGTTTPANTAPSVSLSLSTQSTTAGNQVTATAIASDSDGTVTKVEFYSGATKLGEDTVSPYAYSWTPAAGTYSITAKATDNSGAVSTSSAVTLTVNATTATPKAQNIFVGNSLVYGTPGGPTAGAYPDQLRGLLPAASYGDWVNFGTPGAGALGVYNSIQTQVLDRKDTVNYTMTIVPLPSVINDLAQNRGVEAAWQTMKDYANACANAGIKIWVGTETPCHKEYGIGVAAMEVQRQEINRRIRAYWKTDLKCAALVDWAENATIGTFVQPTTEVPEPWDHTIYSDGQHYLPAGYLIKAQMAKPAYDAMLAGATYGVVTPYPTTPVEPPVDPTLMVFGTNGGWTVNGNSATSTGTQAFASFITSAKSIRGVGYIEGTLRTSNGQVVIGLTDVSNIPRYEETKYPIHIWPPNGVRPLLSAWTNNAYVAIVDGQKFRIGREADGKVHAYINGVQIAVTSAVAVTGDLFMHCSAAAQGSIIENMKMVGDVLVTR